jgi:hypothetical protein
MTSVKETLDANLTEEGGDGRRLNQYQIHQVLGSGSFGTVSLGYSPLYFLLPPVEPTLS